MIDALNDAVVSLFNEPMGSDDLLKMSDIIEGQPVFPQSTKAASHHAIIEEVRNTEDVGSNLTSESELDDYADALRQLAPRAKIADAALRQALDHVDEQIVHVQVSSAKALDPTMPEIEDQQDDEEFGDEALDNLFNSLRL